MSEYKGREYEVLEILNDNFDTLSPEQQEHVMEMFAARNRYRVYKIKPDAGSSSHRPKSSFKRKVGPF